MTDVHDPVRLAALSSYDILDTVPEEGFDDIVQLAMQLCNAPIALVSLVAADRQWFKARSGTSISETDLNSSVCAHALSEPDLLVITDLTIDPRTRDNLLVVGDPLIRFYAGVPLRTHGGDALGTLCVIDTVPRPSALTEGQADGLRRLARQVVNLLELRKAVVQREAALAYQEVLAQREAEARQAVRVSENRYRSVFDSITDFALIVTDRDGRVTEWNTGAERTLGWSAAEMRGHELERIFTPEDRATSRAETEMRLSLQDGRASDERWHLRRDGELFWASGEMMPLRDDDGAHRGHVKVLRDRTAEHLAGRALEETEARLRESEDHLRHTVELNPAVTWTCDPQGNITSYAKRWLDLTGQAPGEPDGAGWPAPGRYRPHDTGFLRLSRVRRSGRYRLPHPRSRDRRLSLDARASPPASQRRRQHHALVRRH